MIYNFTEMKKRNESMEEELQALKSIYLLYMEKERAVSKINQEQEQLLEKTGVDLSLC